MKRGLGIKPDEARVTGIVEKYQFSNLAGRQAGDENVRHFLRKGVAGDWTSKFSPQARETFHRYAGDVLIELGYEQDDRWVTES